MKMILSLMRTFYINLAELLNECGNLWLQTYNEAILFLEKVIFSVVDLFRNFAGEIKPIGFISSLFCHKRGTPRQPTICPHARGVLTLDRVVVNNPQYTLEGLEEFSHIWYAPLYRIL